MAVSIFRIYDAAKTELDKIGVTLDLDGLDCSYAIESEIYDVMCMYLGKEEADAWYVDMERALVAA